MRVYWREVQKATCTKVLKKNFAYNAKLPMYIIILSKQEHSHIQVGIIKSLWVSCVLD